MSSGLRLWSRKPGSSSLSPRVCFVQGCVNTYYFLPSLNESKSCKIYHWPEKDQKVTKHLNFVSNYPVTMNYLHERKRKSKDNLSNQP